ncbi:MAG: electron transfer flavoprotein subunit alpha/FixB family protein [Clostridiaceae bacterium]|nr:electron transfer flavoprotein subunit alpha/FixB family protein [Clostridiaceae bacterium]
MAYLKVNNEKVTVQSAHNLVEICPFSAITYVNGTLEIGAGCKMCKLCVKKSNGIIELIDEKRSVDKSKWKGICVYVEHSFGEIHNVTFELIGKALELAKVTSQSVYALMIGYDIEKAADKLLRYGIDKVFVYDDVRLEDFIMEPYANVFEDMINKIKPSAILVGATNIGRSLAPRVAARFRTGLTADCTVLQMRENSDLVQIRPAFGGNIMAQIVTPYTRPQFCTVRYKVFSAPEPVENPTGEIVKMKISSDKLLSNIKILEIIQKDKEVDISEAEVIVAVGRGVKSQADLELLQQLSDRLNGQMACTRPLVECGWFDARRQIGLSGRTVNAKLIITVGISGAVQFTAGMSGSECIIAINSDPKAPIFNIAHYGLAGDLYEIVPRLIERIKEGDMHGF